MWMQTVQSFREQKFPFDSSHPKGWELWNDVAHISFRTVPGTMFPTRGHMSKAEDAVSEFDSEWVEVEFPDRDG